MIITNPKQLVMENLNCLFFNNQV